MEAFQTEIEDERRKPKPSGLPFVTGVGSLGCWGSLTGLTMSGMSGFDSVSIFRQRGHGPVRVIDVAMPALSGEHVIQQVINHRQDNPRLSSGGLRAREIAWRRTHPMELRQLENQWVVLEGEEIIAHGADVADVIREAKRRGFGKPYVFFVEPRNPNVIMIGI